MGVAGIQSWGRILYYFFFGNLYHYELNVAIVWKKSHKSIYMYILTYSPHKKYQMWQMVCEGTEILMCFVCFEQAVQDRHVLLADVMTAWYTRVEGGSISSRRRQRRMDIGPVLALVVVWLSSARRSSEHNYSGQWRIDIQPTASASDGYRSAFGSNSYATRFVTRCAVIVGWFYP